MVATRPRRVRHFWQASLLVLALPLLAPAAEAGADEVTPSDRVHSRLNVRAQARVGAVVSSLAPGDRVELVATRSGWHEVRLKDGKTGFVSAAWTQVVPPSELPPSELPPIPEQPMDLSRAERPGGFGPVRRFFQRLFGRGPGVDLQIAEPGVDRSIYRHHDPHLPVSGFATARDAGRLFDIVLVIDSSTSTNEYAETDVDRDGRAEDDWKGGDSIYRAQLAAAASFVRTIENLPHNREGQRIRLGLLTCAGEERHRLAPEDADLEVTLETIRWLAHRDARVELPLTRDYAAVDRRLRELWTETPIGMTDAAAGIGRAVIELTGDELRWAESEPRPEAEKVILFLSDGKPSLPYEREKAERFARYAGKLAAKNGIRINAFELGINVVTRQGNRALKRMAQRTGGRHVALAHPGDVVRVLPTTPFSVLDRVQVRNHTSGDESPRIATGIDGSFYAEVPLLEGENQLEVEARLVDGQSSSKSFEVVFVKGVPTRELEQQLAALRGENAALAEQLRRNRSSQLAREREAQEGRLEISVPLPDEEPPPVAAPPASQRN